MFNNQFLYTDMIVTTSDEKPKPKKNVFSERYTLFKQIQTPDSLKKMDEFIKENPKNQYDLFRKKWPIFFGYIEEMQGTDEQWKDLLDIVLKFLFNKNFLDEQLEHIVKKGNFNFIYLIYNIKDEIESYNLSCFILCKLLSRQNGNRCLGFYKENYFELLNAYHLDSHEIANFSIKEDAKKLINTFKYVYNKLFKYVDKNQILFWTNKRNGCGVLMINYNACMKLENLEMESHLISSLLVDGFDQNNLIYVGKYFFYLKNLMPNKCYCLLKKPTLEEQEFLYYLRLEEIGQKNLIDRNKTDYGWFKNIEGIQCEQLFSEGHQQDEIDVYSESLCEPFETQKKRVKSSAS